jgi:hypothetical protein
MNEVKGEGFRFLADPYLWINQEGKPAGLALAFNPD